MYCDTLNDCLLCNPYIHSKNMFSNLKRAKVYFLVTCFVTGMMVFCFYKIILTERKYKFRIPSIINQKPIQNSSISNTRLISGAKKYANLTFGTIEHNIGELRGTVRPDPCKNCFKNDFNLILNVPELCQGEVFLLIMISSTISNRGARDAIRDTWGNTCNKENSRVKCLFLLGISKGDTKSKLLVKESKQHNDIIQHDFIDTYANLTYKTLTAMRWVEEFCPDADFVMKTDDDMFVNTELLPTLLEVAPTEGFVGGLCWGPRPPHRDRQSKWYVSFQQYSSSAFPAMCSGTGYVMSGDVISGILQQSKNTPVFNLEDVYVALCLKKLGIKPVLLKGFYLMGSVQIGPCNYKNEVITLHGKKQNLYSIWKEMNQCEREDLTPELLYLPRPYKLAFRHKVDPNEFKNYTRIKV